MKVREEKQMHDLVAVKVLVIIDAIICLLNKSAVWFLKIAVLQLDAKQV